MAGRWTVAVVVAFLAVIGACEAENRMQATLDRPALVTAKAQDGATLGVATPRVVVTIVAFTPPPDRQPVEIVVTATSGGASHELGRVAVTPYAAFTPADTARHRTFAFPLPPEMKANVVTLSIVLVPVRGGGQGASLEIGNAVIR